MSVTENITNKNKIFIDINNNRYGSFKELKKNKRNDIARVAERATGKEVGRETQGEVSSEA